MMMHDVVHVVVVSDTFPTNMVAPVRALLANIKKYLQ